MSTTKTMTLDEIRNYKLTEEQKEMIINAGCNPDDEAPAMTPEQLKEFKSGKLYHPQWYKPKKAKINIRIDEDVLAAYKALGKGYQTRMNDALRKAIEIAL